MKAYYIQLLNLSCMVGFQNYTPRCSVACKGHVTSLKVKVRVKTYALIKTCLFHIHTLGLTAK